MSKLHPSSTPEPHTTPGSGVLDAAFDAGPDKFLDAGLVDFLRSLPGDDDDASVTARAISDLEVRLTVDWGTSMPTEYRRLLGAVAEAGSWPCFDEWSLVVPRAQDSPPDENTFEAVVRAAQQSVGMELVEVFSGALQIDDPSDTSAVMLPIYSTPDPEDPSPAAVADETVREFRYYGCEDVLYQAGNIADRLSTLVYAHALSVAHDEELVSDACHDRGVRAISGRIGDRRLSSVRSADATFASFDGTVDPTDVIAFQFARSEWIRMLLSDHCAHSGLDLAEWVQMARDLDTDAFFAPRYNPVITADVTAARLAASPSHVPTALYAMWRAFLFDEPELAEYLRVCATARARLTRDSARLIGELRSGVRSTLGSITDVAAWLAEFRALGLDPRRSAKI